MAQEPECKAPCSRNTSRGEVIGPEWQRGFASTSLHSREVIGPEWRGALLQPRGQDKGSASTLHLTQNQTGLCFNLVGNRVLLQPCCRDKGSASTLHPNQKQQRGSASTSLGNRALLQPCCRDKGSASALHPCSASGALLQPRWQQGSASTLLP